ncbi:MAG: hypothetical protein KAU14_03165 [Thermoplasmata archaeon]|nr:hypothetical protein [Thermoplasmata archaeon]
MATMKSLLTAAKDLLKTFNTPGGVLEDVAIKRGILPPIPLFPTICLLPSDETFFERSSGRRYKVRRGISVEVYVKGLNTKDMVDDIMQYVEKLKDIFRDNFTVSGECYDVELGDSILGEPTPYKNRFVQRGALPISCKSKEFVTAMEDPGTDLYEEDIKDLLDRIYAKVLASTDLSNVKLKKRNVVKPVGDFPMIAVNENLEASRREDEVGIERVERVFELLTFTKMLAKERALDFCLDVTENVKSLVQKHRKWDGYVWNSEIDSIVYGQYSDANTLMYNSQINLRCQCKEAR